MLSRDKVALDGAREAGKVARAAGDIEALKAALDREARILARIYSTA